MCIVPVRAQYIRVMFTEITRIFKSFINITTCALDVVLGFLGFEEKEKLMEFYEKSILVLGMHAAYFRPEV